MHLRCMVLDGDPEGGGKTFVVEHQFGNWELLVGITPGQGGGLVLGLPVGPRDHDRPRCGGRGFLGFSGSRRGHGRASRGGDGRGYQGPGCGRGGGTKRSRRGGNSGDRGGAQSQRLWDGGGDQSRKIGRSRRLPSSGGDRSREMGRSPRLLCRWSRWLCREPGEAGGVDALSLREGCGRGVLLSFDRSNACLTLPVSPCRFSEGRGRFLEPMAGGSGVAVQGGELRTKRGCHAFVFGSCQIECDLVGGGPRGGIVGHLRVGGAFLYIVEGHPLHGGQLRRGKAIPNGCQVPKMGRGSVVGGKDGSRQWGGGA